MDALGAHFLSLTASKESCSLSSYLRSSQKFKTSNLSFISWNRKKLSATVAQASASESGTPNFDLDEYSASFEPQLERAPKRSSSPSEKKRTGLYRIPVSGSVQSATSVHGLPTPAVAVRNLIEQARYGHLCTVMSRMHHRRKGYPFGSLVEFATDEQGHPIFLLSPLAIHTRNLLADPRCTLVVQIPGGSGLANARVTFFGDVYPLPAESQEWAQRLYTAKHHHGASQQWGNFYLYRMDVISDIYFVGGFGTVAWVEVGEYAEAQPDRIAANSPETTLEALNSRFSKQLKKLLAAATQEQTGGRTTVDDAALISIDSKGVDVRVRTGAQFNVQRLSFQPGQGVESLEQASVALQELVDAGFVSSNGIS